MDKKTTDNKKSLKTKYVLIGIAILLLVGICAFFISRGLVQDQPTYELPLETPLTPENTTYSWSTTEPYEAMLHSLGYIETKIDTIRPMPSTQSDFHATELIVTDDKFQLNFQYNLFLNETDTEKASGQWQLYGQKADAIALVAPVDNIDQYVKQEESVVEEFTDANSEIPSTYRQIVAYNFFDSTDEEAMPAMAVYAVYYPQTKNLYNFVQTDFRTEMYLIFPSILWMTKEDELSYKPLNSSFYMEDGYPVEIAEFHIYQGNKKSTYQYRVGMTLPMWAASGLTQGDWVGGLYNCVYSKDYKNLINLENIDIRLLLDDNHSLTATKTSETFDSDLPDYLNSMMSSILTPTSIVHYVNWYTPLQSVGVKIDSRYSEPDFAMGHQVSILMPDEEVTISLIGVPDEVLPDVELKVFKEPLSIVESWETERGFAGHISPLKEKDEMLTVPDTAYCIPFERAENIYQEDDCEGECTESHLLYDKVASVTFQPDRDPNFDFNNPNVYAITYKDKVVYWIHIPVYNRENNIVDFSKFSVIKNEDGSFELYSDVYSDEELDKIRETLTEDPALADVIAHMPTTETGTLELTPEQIQALLNGEFTLPGHEGDKIVFIPQS